MICARCSHEVGPRARFGEVCGAPLLDASAASAGTTTESDPDLARLQAAQGQPLEASKVLAPVCGLFTDGADMVDVQDARAVRAGVDG